MDLNTDFVPESTTTGRKLAQGEHNKAVRFDYIRNATSFVTWEFIWGLGLPFAMFATVVPAYLNEMLRMQREEHATYYGVMIWVTMMLEQWLAAHDGG